MHCVGGLIGCWRHPSPPILSDIPLDRDGLNGLMLPSRRPGAVLMLL